MIQVCLQMQGHRSCGGCRHLNVIISKLALQVHFFLGCFFSPSSSFSSGANRARTWQTFSKDTSAFLYCDAVAEGTHTHTRLALTCPTFWLVSSLSHLKFCNAVWLLDHFDTPKKFIWCLELLSDQSCASSYEDKGWVWKCVFTLALHCCISWNSSTFIIWSNYRHFIFTDRMREEGERRTILWRGYFQLRIVHTTPLGNFTLHNSALVIICLLECPTEYCSPHSSFASKSQYRW